MDRLVIVMYRHLGGRLIGRRLLLMTTRGRRSGLARVVPLAYWSAEGGYMVAAGNRRPGWFHNLIADSEVGVQIGRAVFRGTATVDPESLTVRLELRPGADPIPGDWQPLPRACGRCR